ncbi:hypothetical protein N7466_011121 [Penicillium verhagenii]|uniref:uncharacterized protein n=1 Tax=Penicillium verhagenii TaxID=1562060 RepID=UPI002545380B|nr:uncharacterized protein N7466_011108 [Penicillium verhagenii]XP_057016242.1 uncharacterized protein N7466_011121 [Penicillium verhagenii]KAJ5917554.1 hypothetical protein N7466_011108 [Penicillium verhagenii]KAJ5917567.1 hypothetical protein N7466_011121 [Penicillium verhagenii]
MAPRLSPCKLEMIRDMIECGSVTILQMATAAECSERSIVNIRNNLRLFGHARSPSTRVGRRRIVTPPMIKVKQIGDLLNFVSSIVEHRIPVQRNTIPIFIRIIATVMEYGKIPGQG